MMGKTVCAVHAGKHVEKGCLSLQQDQLERSYGWHVNTRRWLLLILDPWKVSWVSWSSTSLGEAECGNERNARSSMGCAMIGIVRSSEYLISCGPRDCRGSETKVMNREMPCQWGGRLVCASYVGKHVEKGHPSLQRDQLERSYSRDVNTRR